MHISGERDTLYVYYIHINGQGSGAHFWPPPPHSAHAWGPPLGAPRAPPGAPKIAPGRPWQRAKSFSNPSHGFQNRERTRSVADVFACAVAECTCGGQERAKSGQEQPRSGQEQPKRGHQRPKSDKNRCFSFVLRGPVNIAIFAQITS